MKTLFVVPDGAADHAVASLGGKTPLEAARTPHMDRLAREGRTGLARTIPEGMPAGSDVGHLSLLGYDPRRYFTGGRAPIEAAALGITLGAEDAAFRVNLVTIEGDRMVDYSAGHITTAQSRPIVEAFAREIVRAGWIFFPGVEYRHILRWEGYGQARALPVTAPPHDLTGKPFAPHLPSGEGAEALLEIMERSKAIVPRFGTKATQAWIWSGGRAPALPTLAARFGVTSGAATSSVDIVRGLAALAGLAVIPVPGQTALWDTDYAAEGRAAVKALTEEGRDFVYVHVEAPDEATHAGLLEEKIAAIERIDADIVGPCVAALERAGRPFRVLISPDHATTIATRTHAPDPVPYLLYGSGIPASGAVGYGERAAAAAKDPLEGHSLLEALFA